jgi:hypothetical protein
MLADIGNKIFLEKNPPFTQFCTGYFPRLGLSPECLPVHFQEVGGIMEIQRVHDFI